MFYALMGSEQHYLLNTSCFAVIKIIYKCERTTNMSYVYINKHLSNGFFFYKIFEDGKEVSHLGKILTAFQDRFQNRQIF